MRYPRSIGIIPAGGTGTRLGLPFPKELFNIGDEEYYPVIRFSLNCMAAAGCKEFILIVNETKAELVQYTSKWCYRQGAILHVVFNDEGRKGYARGLLDIQNLVRRRAPERLLFCLPDSVYENERAFRDLIEGTGPCVLGAFRVGNDLRVDRIHGGAVHTKTVYDECPSDLMWGILNIRTDYYEQMVIDLESHPECIEIGQVIGRLGGSTHLDLRSQYYDLGTWPKIREFFDNFRMRNEKLTRHHAGVNPRGVAAAGSITVGGLEHRRLEPVTEAQ
jgi:hypothetical protein